MTLYYFSIVLPALGILLRLIMGCAADNLLLFILVCVAAILLGLRTVGADYSSYLDYIEYIQQSKNLADVIDIVRDPAFYFIVKSTATMSSSSAVVFFCIGALTLAGVALSLPKPLKNKTAAFCLYLFFFGAGLNYEAIRAGMGLAFFLLAGRFLNYKLSYILSLVSISSHLSLLLPVLSSASRWLNELICRRPILALGFPAIVALVVPVLFILNERLLSYVNIEELGVSKSVAALALQASVYSMLTRVARSRSATRSYLLSAALITLCLSVAFSQYSEIAGSRISEMGSAIFYMLLVQDFVDRIQTRLSVVRSTIIYLIVFSFSLQQGYSNYLRFVVSYEFA